MAMPSREGGWIAAAALNGLVAVAAGAAGSHAGALAGGADASGWMETGSRYQLWHALALLAVILLRRGGGSGGLLRAAGWGFLVGMVLFSGNLYVMALTGHHALAWLTPTGGALLLIGWAALLLHGLGRLRLPG
jgi:uncharacterized membrane protein YgdD (TMEM256/DUF423 family)